MIVEKGKVVTFTYELKLKSKDGEVIQRVEKSRPLSIVAGKGNILEAFEKKLFGLKAGDDFELLIKNKNAYGRRNEKAVAEYDKQAFMKENDLSDEDLQPGNFLPMESNAGTPFNAEIAEVTADRIKLDFNHPLAGKDLYFKGKILKVRDATKEEIDSGLVQPDKEK